MSDDIRKQYVGDFDFAFKPNKTGKSDTDKSQPNDFERDNTLKTGFEDLSGDELDDRIRKLRGD